MIRFLLLLLALWTGAAAAEPELLEPEKAFRFSARLAAPDAVEVRFQIAKDYYLYRDKFAFAAEPPTVELGAPTSFSATSRFTAAICASSCP